MTENKCNEQAAPSFLICINMKLTPALLRERHKLEVYTELLGAHGEWERAVTASGVSQESSGRVLGSWDPLKEKNCSKSFQEQRGE